MSALRKGLACVVLLTLLVFQAEMGAGMQPTASASATSATLTWTAPGDDWNTGRAWRYDLRFSTEQIAPNDSLGWWTAPSTVVCTGLPEPSEPGSVDSVVVTGLTPGTTYYFVLRTADEVPNWSFFSNVAVVTTLAQPDTTPPGDDSPPSPVAGLVAAPVEEGISLTWNPCPDADVIGYLVYRGFSAGQFEAITMELINETSYLDTHVLAGVTYYYTVTAVDYSHNESPIAQTVSATALSVTPIATRLLAPFPDPCVSEVILRYEIAEDGTYSTVRVFDINGRLMRELYQGTLQRGQYSTVWDLRAENGERVVSGIYFCILSSSRGNSTKKIAVLR